MRGGTYLEKMIFIWMKTLLNFFQLNFKTTDGSITNFDSNLIDKKVDVKRYISLMMKQQSISNDFEVI